MATMGYAPGSPVTPGMAAQAAAAAAGGGDGGIFDRLMEFGNRPGVRKAGGGILGAMIISRLIQAGGSGIGNYRLQRQAIQQQAEMASPENMYLQASLPGAQQEEEMARQALFAQLTGGVIGPSLATGESRIGGR